MYPRRRYIEIAFVLLICLSGILLGVSHDNKPLLWTAVAGALVSFFLVDYFRLFHLTGWLANIASVLILLYAMRDFFGGDSAVKLISVAVLLVYLQCVLVFQRKTPRIYWQIFVLSFLQIVVAAIFNLNFEGSVLFVAYFAVALVAMMLQNDFSNWFNEFTLNQSNIADGESQLKQLSAGQQQAIARPCLVSPQRERHYLGRMLFQTIPWVMASLLFSLVLFYMIPRSEDAWVGPGVHRVIGTGMNQKVNLDERNRIQQSDTLVFRASFTDSATGAPVELPEMPYFRGMPLPRFSTDNGHTDWQAPQDSVYEHSYRSLEFFFSNDEYGSTAKRLKQTVILDGTVDPLLYVAMPAYRAKSIDEKAEYCHDLSALTRRRKGDFTELSTYKYETILAVDEKNRPLGGWPYRTNGGFRRDLTMNDAPGERKGLVHLERERYPKLIAAAEQVADSEGTEDSLQLCNAMLDYFRQPDRFKYTIDLREVPRISGVDAVEDFFANHRSGHCELFASALVLMLRSQDVPARIVLGFYGGEYNSSTDCYMVRTTSAHAWVEAYIPPEDCTDEMRASGMAGSGGCWLVLDPTPETANPRGSDALDLARTLWQDYVMTVDEEQQAEVMDVSTGGILGVLQLDKIRSFVDRSFAQLRDQPALQGLFVFLIFVIVLLVVFFNREATDRRTDLKKRKSPGSIRRFVAGGLNLISPKLGALILAGDETANRVVPFYVRMSRALGRLGLQKATHQTHREFANSAIEKIQLSSTHLDNEPSQVVVDAIRKITNTFYQVRFGDLALDNDGLEDIERTVESLETALKGVAMINK